MYAVNAVMKRTNGLDGARAVAAGQPWLKKG